MQNKKFAVFGIAAASALVLSACGGNATPIVQTVVVEKVSTQVVEKIATQVVQQTSIVQVTVAPPTARPEWSTPHPVLSKKEVRQAIAHCTDVDELIKVSYPFLSPEQRKAAVMDSFIPKDSAWYAKTPLTQYPFDLAKGNGLLETAGFKLPASAKLDANGAVPAGALRANDKGEPLLLKFTTTNAPFRQTWGGAFTRQMARCGITIQPSYIPGSIWFGGNSGLRRRDFELGAFAWVGETDPPGVTLYACDQIPLPTNGWNGQNYMGWCNQAASSAIKLANNTLSKEEALKQYDVVQQEFAKDMISLPVFQRVEANGFNKNLKNGKNDPTEYWSANAFEWELPGKDTIVIALGQEPASMFSIQESAAVQRVIAQMVEGVPNTKYNYDYQPVWHADDKFPTIENGGATNTEVEVKQAEGAKMVDANGDILAFKGGKWMMEDGKTEAKDVKVKDIKGVDSAYKDGSKLPQLVVTHKMKPQKWSDGQPVVKADWELGYKVDCDRESGATSFFGCDRTAKYEVVDDNTIRITYVPGYQPRTYFLWGDAPGRYPAHLVIKTAGPYAGKKLAEVAPKDFKTLPEVAETPLGTGPYILKEWRKGTGMTLEANPNYFRGAPKVKNVRVQIFDANPAGAVAALLSGQVDIVGKEVIGAGSELEQVVKAGQEGKILGVPSASPTWEHVDMNLFIR